MGALGESRAPARSLACRELLEKVAIPKCDRVESLPRTPDTDSATMLMAGAGIPGGQIVGATDVKGYHAAENVYRPEDFAASLYKKMGIDPNMTLQTNTGRPIHLVNEGRMIKELFV